LTKEEELPPVGITAEGEVLTKVSLFAEVVVIIPFVSNSSLLTSTNPFVPMVNPESLLISILLNLFAPEKLPVGPPRVWVATPAKETVEAGDEPDRLRKRQYYNAPLFPGS